MANIRVQVLVGSLFLLLVVLLFFLLMSPRFTAKRQALVSVGNTLVHAGRHQAVIVEGGGRVLKAQHNLEVVTRATEYMGTFGSGTLVFREIARIAAEADRECPRLEAVLDLAARSTSEHLKILALAESACSVQGADQEAAWQEAYDEMAAMAAYRSVEEAVADQRH